MNFVLWFAQNLQIGRVIEYTRQLWTIIVDKNIKGGQASIILSCKNDDLYDKILSICFINS